jgi:hypothetical protein
MPVYIFAGGGYTNNKVFKYDSALNKLGESPNYGTTTDGSISSIHNDETHLYITGADSSSGGQTAKKIRISDMAVVTSTPAYGAFQTKYGFLLNGYYYMCGPFVLKIYKYSTSDMSKVGESALLSYTARAFSTDGTYLYAASFQNVIKYDPSDFSILATSPNYGSTIYSTVCFGSHLFVGGQTTQTVRKYNLSDLSYVSQSANLGNTVSGLYQDGTYVYAAAGQYIYKLNPSSLSTVATSPAYGGNLQCISGDGAYIYAAGVITNKVFKYNSSDLSKIAESGDYGTTISALNVLAKTFFEKELGDAISAARTARRQSRKNQLQKILRSVGTVNRNKILNKLLTDIASVSSTVRRQIQKRLTNIIRVSRSTRRHINRTLIKIVKASREVRRRAYKAFTKGIKTVTVFSSEYILGAIKKTITSGVIVSRNLTRRTNKTLLKTTGVLGTFLAGLPAPVLEALQNITGCLYITWM